MWPVDCTERKLSDTGKASVLHRLNKLEQFKYEILSRDSYTSLLFPVQTSAEGQGAREGWIIRYNGGGGMISAEKLG